MLDPPAPDRQTPGFACMFFRLNAPRSEKIAACAASYRGSKERALLEMLRAFGKTHQVEVPLEPLPDNRPPAKGKGKRRRAIPLLIPKVDSWPKQLILQSQSRTLAAMVERAIDQYELPAKKKVG